MEREKTRNKKRTRDDHGGDHDKKKESQKGKKQESVLHDFFDINDHNYQYYEFCDGIGVFDFPWLKEGVIFIADEYLEPEEMFGPCSYLEYEEANNNILQDDQSCVQSLYGYNNYFHDKKLDDDSFWSLEIDDFEPIDCIWSCLIDQPLDIGLNKG